MIHFGRVTTSVLCLWKFFVCILFFLSWDVFCSLPQPHRSRFYAKALNIYKTKLEKQQIQPAMRPVKLFRLSAKIFTRAFFHRKCLKNRYSFVFQGKSLHINIYSSSSVGFLLTLYNNFHSFIHQFHKYLFISLSSELLFY